MNIIKWNKFYKRQLTASNLLLLNIGIIILISVNMWSKATTMIAARQQIGKDLNKNPRPSITTKTKALAIPENNL